MYGEDTNLDIIVYFSQHTIKISEFWLNCLFQICLNKAKHFWKKYNQPIFSIKDWNVTFSGQPFNIRPISSNSY